MKGIAQAYTQPELRVMATLAYLGYRYGTHILGLPGRPDFVFPLARKAIFVHGCFWHGHSICTRLANLSPKNNAETWRRKILATQLRDKRQMLQLNDLGWTTLTIWECQTSDPFQLAFKVIAFIENIPIQ